MPASLAHALKLFLPSWNFFDDFSATPRLEYRVRASDDSAPDDWRIIYASHSTHSLGRTLYNPHGNAELFELALVETAADELKLIERGRRGSFLDSETWSRLAPHLMRHIPDGRPRQVQFRLRLTTRQGDPEEWFETPWLPLDRASP